MVYLAWRAMEILSNLLLHLVIGSERVFNWCWQRSAKWYETLGSEQTLCLSICENFASYDWYRIFYCSYARGTFETIKWAPIVNPKTGVLCYFKCVTNVLLQLLNDLYLFTCIIRHNYIYCSKNRRLNILREKWKYTN